MKFTSRIALLLAFAAYGVMAHELSATTYYVGVDGGSRYTTGVLTGQCNGKTNASYASTGAITNARWQPNHLYTVGDVITDSGPAGTLGFYRIAASTFTSGASVAGPVWSATGPTTDPNPSGSWTQGSTYPVNQNCKFSDARYLWQDGEYTDGSTMPVFPGWGWVLAGGDTAIIEGSIADGVSYRVGWGDSTTYCTATGCWGKTGDQGGSGAPPIPSGTMGSPTIIQGANAGSCHAQTARTQLHGGWGTDDVLNIIGSSNVEIDCIDITDFSNCGRDTDVVSCTSPLKDYAGTGIAMYSTTTNITLNDIRIHGMAQDGLTGSPGGGFTANYFDILGNADAGWNSDPADGTTGKGSLNVTNYEIGWNGCVEEYPIVDPLPYFSCTDQSSGGYGDGFGSASVDSPSPGWQVHFDQGIVDYNTQDGLDALHIGGAGSSMTVTRTLAYGSEGQQIKVGGATATVQNNLIIGNCEAMSTQAIPGTPTGFGSLLGDACRAGNTAILLNVAPGLPARYQYNTMFSEGSVGLEVEPEDGIDDPTNTILYNNNVFVGFFNADNGENPTPIYSNVDLSMFTNSGASWTHNATFGARSNWMCPATGESNAICTSPQLQDMTYHPYGYGNMAPTIGAVVLNAGVPIGITVDLPGATRNVSTPTEGACELSIGSPLCPTMSAPPSGPTSSTIGAVSAVGTVSTIP